jgi:hypothetical protein
VNEGLSTNEIAKLDLRVDRIRLHQAKTSRGEAMIKGSVLERVIIARNGLKPISISLR